MVVEIDKDKKYLGEDCFTLADLVELVLSKFNKGRKNASKLSGGSRVCNNASTPLHYA